MSSTFNTDVRITGWPIVGWCSAVILTMTAAILGTQGVGESGLRMVIRTSAMTSLVLFSAAFVASSLRRLWPSRHTRWLLANRRHVGVSFAASHFVHLLAIISLASVSPQFEVDAVALVGGGLAYVFIAAMTATSFDRTAAWVGPRVWRGIHTTGAYYIWAIFFVSYLPRALQSPVYWPVVLVLIAGIALRISARAARR